MESRNTTGQGFKKIGRTWLRFLTFSIIVLFCLSSCERDIDIKLIEQEQKLVVEATIENGQPPVVLLSRSLDYFSQLSADLLAKSFVHGADVFVSNGTKTQKLREYTTPVAGGYGFSYYTVDSANLGQAFFGEFNKAYQLRIVADGKEYTSATTIPNATKRIDSVWWKKAPPQADSNDVIVMVKATDPPGFGDYIRYFTKRNREPFLPPFNSTFDDLFVDGTTYQLPIERGVDRNLAKIEDEDRFFKRGDTVTLKLCNVDRATYDFWRTMEFSYSSVGNPFSTPVKVQSNITGNALGYFGGYAAQYRTLIIPR